MSQRHRAGKLDDCLRQLRGDTTAFTASCITNIFRRICIPRALSVAYHGYIEVPCSVCNANGRRSARYCISWAFSTAQSAVSARRCNCGNTQESAFQRPSTCSMHRQEFS